MYGWFAPSKQATKPYLPDPSKEGSEKEALKVPISALKENWEGSDVACTTTMILSFAHNIGKHATTFDNIAAAVR
jgi:hypothetical protein